MPFGFDPRSLVKQEQEKEKNIVKDVLTEQEEYDALLEKQKVELKLIKDQEEKQKSFDKVTDKVDDVLKEVNFINKKGLVEYLKEKKKEDPENILFQNKDIFKKVGSAVKSEFSGEAKAYTLAETEDKEVKDRPSAFDAPDLNDVGIGQAVSSAIVSGTIKIGAGFFQFGAMVKDAFAEDGVPVDESNLAKFNKIFEESYLGMASKYNETRARERAIGRLTEAGVQLYGGYKTAGKAAIKIAEKMTGLFNKAAQAYKKGKYIKATGNKDLYKAAKEIKKLNTMSGGQKFAAVSIGGGFGTAAVIYKSEDIGTFGDIFFNEGEYLAMDRERKSDAKDDALRQLYNKFKFGAELAVPIIPLIIGGGRVGKLIAKKSKDLAYSNKKIEQLVDKYISQPFRSRGSFEANQFKGIQRMEGFKESARKITEDYLKNFDAIIHRIEKKAMPASRASGLTEKLSESFVKFINKGKFATKGKQIIPQGFSKKDTNEFIKTMTDDLKINRDDAVSLMDEFFNVQKTWADFINVIYKGKNVNLGKNEFVDLMNNRINESLSTEFKIFGDKSVKAVDEFAPASDVKRQVADIFIRTAKQNSSSLSKEEANMIVNDIIKNVRLNKQTNTPIFKFGTNKVMPLQENAVITKNIAENVTGGGKFKPDKKGGLVQTEKDLSAFKNLFGSYKNAENIISNVTTDLSTVVARDNFYNFIKQTSDQMIKRGERGIVYNNYNDAVKAFGPNKKIVDASVGLDLPNTLGKEAYTPSIQGMFTTEDIAMGLINGSKDALGSITKSALYQWAVLIPKGLVQAGKTVGGPFTHARNFSSGAITTIYLGNIAIPPKELAKAIRTAYRTIQPQFFGRNRPGLNIDANKPKVYGANTIDPNKLVGGTEFVEEGGQSLYRFLLDEGMVNSSARAREVELLIQDSAKTGFLDKVWKRLGTKVQKFIKGAQEAYVAEDDAWKIFNFVGESYRIRNAYAEALKAGKIKMKDVPGGSLESMEILRMATKKVRDMLPNYNYVSPFVKSTRKLPTGNFVGWTAEQIRTFPNTLNTAIEEIRSPIFAKMGWQRLAGMATTLAALPPLAVWSFQQLYGFTEKKLDALKEFIPSFSKDKTILPIYEDGKYKYIDFSRGFFYETLIDPVQTLFTTIEMNPNKPLAPLVWEATGKAAAKVLDPFISEAIWVGAWLDLAVRKGQSRDGRQIWNPEDDEGDKAIKAFKHLGETFSVGSALQFKRVIAALTGETIKGVEYDLSDELLGLLGFRAAPIDLERSLNFKLYEFLEAERNIRNIMYYETRTGDPVPGNKLIGQMIDANEKRYEKFNSVRRTIDAALFLGVPEDVIKEVFDSRGKKNLFNKVMDNEFISTGLTERVEKGFEKDAEKRGIPNTVDDYTKDTLRDLQEIMNDLPLNEPWRIKKEDFLMKDTPTKLAPGFSQNTQPATNNTAPAKVTTAQPQINQQDGLTGTERALLSPIEKEIAKTS